MGLSASVHTDSQVSYALTSTNLPMCSSLPTALLTRQLRRRSGVLISQATSVQPWLYVMICAICIVLLGILVLIAFLWTRRRKRTNGSDIQPPASPPGSPACSSPSPPSYTAATEESADAAGFCVVTGTVDVQSYGRRMSREKLVALNDMQDDSGRKFHVYDQIAAQSQ